MVRFLASVQHEPWRATVTSAIVLAILASAPVDQPVEEDDARASGCPSGENRLPGVGTTPRGQKTCAHSAEQAEKKDHRAARGEQRRLVVRVRHGVCSDVVVVSQEQ
jgi:hypothetical protein